MSEVRITEWNCPFLGRVVSYEYPDGTEETFFDLPARVREAIVTIALAHDIETDPASFMEELVLDYIASGADDDHVNGHGMTPEERCLRLIQRWRDRQPQVTVN